MEVLAASFAKSPLKVYSVLLQLSGNKISIFLEKRIPEKIKPVCGGEQRGKKFTTHEIPGISFRQTGNWTPEDEIFGINCRNLAPAKREILSHRNGRFPPFETTLRLVFKTPSIF